MMRVSLEWLKAMTDLPDDLASFTQLLELTGTAVDAVDKVGPSLDGVVVGQILAAERLPDSDHLWLTSVDVGANHLDADGAPTPLGIVCGAQNFQVGDKVAVALVGTTLPGGAQIKRTKMRGVESNGMNCSAMELGLGEDHGGIMILEPDAQVGMPVAECLGLSDTVLDLEITPNRPDCMGVHGVAREVAAILGQPYRLPAVEELVGPAQAFGGNVDRAIEVVVDDPIRCPRYTARLIRGVKVGPSPDWLVERLIAAGSRPVNNIVDITNYIMFEVGQPLHAFDFDTLSAGPDGRVGINVRAARPGERFTTLDGVERVLTDDVTCIVDSHAGKGSGQTVALAGVMGGQASEVTGQTVNVLLESAAFSPNHTSRTSRRLQLISESSSRYERGVDDATCEEYSARAAAMIVALAGGELAEGVVDCYPAPRLLPSLEFRVARFQAFVGAAIAESEAAAILTRLGCEVLPGAAGTLAVRPPSYRPDLLREVDLYEEVLRVHGMDRVPPTLPGGRERIGSEGDAQRLERRLGLLLRAMGLSETMTYAFVPPSDATDVPMPFDEKEQAAELINPISAEMSVLRRSLLPSLLRSVAYNLNHGVPDIQLYEIGTVFFAAEGRKVPKERQLLSAVLVGSRHEPSWSRNAEPVDFYDAKGILEAIGGELNVAKLRFKRLEPEVSGWLTYGRAASVLAGSSRLGWVGEVHPRVRAAFGIEVPVIAFELEVSPLAKAALAMRDFVPIPLYPAVMRDLAVVVDSQVTAEQVSQVLTSAGGALLAEARLFDVFEDADRLGADKKSLAFALSYRSPDRTLTSEEVEALHLKVVAKVSSVLGGEIRA